MNYIGLAILIFIFITMAIGVWSFFRIRGEAVNYFKAGAMMPVWVVGISLIAPAIDANGSIGAAARSFDAGFWAGACIPLGLSLCMFFLGAFFAKPLWKMNIMTLPDFYRMRYNKTTEGLATITMVISSVILLSGNLAGLGILFNNIFNLPYLLMIVLLALFILIYSLTGGVIASLTTSVFQVLIFSVAILLSLFWLTTEYGLDTLMSRVPENHKSLAGLTEMKSGAFQNWAAIISLALGNIIALDLVQRIITAKSPQAAQRSCYMASGLILVIAMPVSVLGLYAIHLDGKSGFSVLIDLAVQDLPGWIGLLLILGIIAASIAVSSGVILAMANAISRNIIQSNVKTQWSSKRLIALSRLMAIPAMIIAVVFAYLRPEPGTLLILAFDIVLAGCFVPFLFGIFWRKANAVAAITSIVSGAAIRLGLFFVVPYEWSGLDTVLPPVITAVLFVFISSISPSTSPSTMGDFERP